MLVALVRVLLLAAAATILLSFGFEKIVSARSLEEVESWQPFSVDECQTMLLLVLLSGLTFVRGMRPAQPRAALRSFRDRLPPARGLDWIKIKLLDGTTSTVRPCRKIQSIPPILRGLINLQ